MLDTIKVDVYGNKAPLNQVGNISVPEARLITISIWDANNVSTVEKAIRESSLGLNPMTEGNLIRIPIMHYRRKKKRIVESGSSNCRKLQGYDQKYQKRYYRGH